MSQVAVAGHASTLGSRQQMLTLLCNTDSCYAKRAAKPDIRMTYRRGVARPA